MAKKYILGLLLVVMILGGMPVRSQQLPQFSQYIFNGLHINPGYAGYKAEGYVQSTYRSQWVNFSGAPRTISLTADFSLNEGEMGFGVSYVRDKIGLTESNLGMLTYAYRINTSDKGRLSLGISGGLSQFVFDPKDIITVDPDDPTLPASRVAATVPNMNTGVFYHDDRFYAGFSAYNMIGRQALLRKDVAVAFHDFHYYLTFGGIFDLTDNIQLKPSVLVKHVKGAPTSYDLNAMFLFLDRVWMGASFRSNARIFEDELQDNLSKRNAVAMVVEYFFTPGLRLGYAYDYNLNALNSYRNQSHEISMGVYLLGKKEIIYNPRWF